MTLSIALPLSNAIAEPHYHIQTFHYENYEQNNKKLHTKKQIKNSNTIIEKN